jgi:hypothetical protein
MVIITPPEFAAQLEPFIAWKVARGFQVVVGELGTPAVGVTAASIQAYIHGLYHDGRPEAPAPSFVLLVGDVEQIPTFTEGESPDFYPTDRPYCAVDGDSIPDIYYGRFSATNSDQLQAMLDKTLKYDQCAMADPSYLGEVVLIAGMDAYHGLDWANGQVNYGTTHYFNEPHGITSHTYLYPNSGNYPTQIIQRASDGVGYINYTAHGNAAGWSNPSFDREDVRGLANADQYCLAVGNCCSSANFAVAECVAETWLRVPQKGAIGYIGGSDLTYWDEDYWWAVGATAVITSTPTYAESGLGAYDGLWHDHGEVEDLWYVTSDAIIYCGNLAVMETGSELSTYYWGIYNLQGDPSLCPYLGVPATNPVGHPTSILSSATALALTALPGSYVGLSQDGELQGAGVVGESGEIEIAFTQTPLNPEAPLRLVATAQNHATYIADIPVEVPVWVNLDPEQIIVATDTELTVTVREIDGVTPQVGIEVWAEGWDYTTTPAVTDEHGMAVLSLNCPYGPTLTVLGQDPALPYRQFERDLTVKAPSLLAPDLSVHTGLGLVDTFALDWPGVLRATLDEPGHTLHAILPAGGSLSSGADSLVITPESLGDIRGVIAVPGYNLYAEQFPVVVVETGGLLIIDDSGAAGGSRGALANDLAWLGYDFKVETCAQLQPARWHTYDLVIVHGGDNPTALEDVTVRDALVAYVNAGGHLLLEGGEVGRLYHANDPDFARDVLHIEGWRSGTGGHILVCESNHWIVSVPHALTVLSSTTYQDSTDQDAVVAGADAVMVAFWTHDMETASLLAYDPTPAPEGGQIVYFPFAYDAMDMYGRVQLLENCLLWLTTPDDEPQGVAAGPVAVTLNAGSVVLTWSYATAAVDGFHVYRRTVGRPYHRLTSSLLTGQEGRIVFTDPATDVIPGAVVYYYYTMHRAGEEIGRSDEVAVVLGEQLPTEFALYPSYPNPFNPVTNIQFALPRPGFVSLRIYDPRGRLVQTLAEGNLPAGIHRRQWTGTDAWGRQVASGVYYCQLLADAHLETRKMLLVR